MRDRGLIRLIRRKTPKLTPWEIIEALRVVAAHDERGCRCGACNLAGAIEIFLDGPISLMDGLLADFYEEARAKREAALAQ
jgi:hypothetical protein